MTTSRKYQIITGVCKCGHGDEYHLTNEDLWYDPPILGGLGHCEECPGCKYYEEEEENDNKK